MSLLGIYRDFSGFFLNNSVFESLQCDEESQEIVGDRQKGCTTSCMGVNVDSKLVTAVRLIRGFGLLLGLFFIEHCICAWANLYTTTLYVELAKLRPAQYAVPLHDTFFDVIRYCPSEWQTTYDLALWLLGFWVIYLIFANLVSDGKSFACEHLFIVMLLHTIFMVLCQVSTTLPASGGIQECLDANPNGLYWPWYGVSFLTQSFAGGRACGDMIYSGHVSNLVLLAVGGARYCLTSSARLLHWTMSLVFGAVACVLIVKCQDHYSVDVVLAVGISVLLFTNTHLETLATKWGHFNYEIESDFLGSKAGETKAKKI